MGEHSLVDSATYYKALYQASTIEVLYYTIALIVQMLYNKAFGEKYENGSCETDFRYVLCTIYSFAKRKVSSVYTNSSSW